MKAKKALTITVTVTLVLFFVAAFVVEARPFGHRMQKHGMGSGFGGLSAFLNLKLTDAQQETMTNILNRYREQRESLRDRLMEMREKQMSIVHAETFDEDAARKAFREGSSVREDMFVLRAKMMAEMKAVLTPEQLETLKERKTERFGKMKKRFGPWSGNAND